MYSFSYLEPVCCSMSSSNCCFLTYIQISQEAGQVVWYFHLFQNFSQFIVIHTVKGFGIVNKAEIDVLLELSCFFDDPADVSNLISGSSALSKSSLNIWKFTVHVFLKPDLESFEYYFNVCEMFEHLCSSLSILWHCLSLGLECKRTFSSPVATAEFSKFAGILSAALSQHHLVGFEVAKVEFNHLHWHQTPVLLPGKSHGWRSLVGCSPWGSLRVGHNCTTSLSLFTFMHWRRKWQPTPVFLPGESQGWVGCHLWGRTESDMTEAT